MDTPRTYKDLFNDNQRLLTENEQLRKEVECLKRLFSDKFFLERQDAPKETISDSTQTGNSYKQAENRTTLSLQDKVTLFRSLFKGREDVFARRWYSRTSGKSGYQPVCLNE